MAKVAANDDFNPCSVAFVPKGLRHKSSDHHARSRTRTGLECECSQHFQVPSARGLDRRNLARLLTERGGLSYRSVARG